MSAYIMTQEDINDILNFFVNKVGHNQLWIKLGDDYDYLTTANAQKAGEVLYGENIRSVNYRYNEDTKDDFVYKHTYKQVTTKQVSRLIDSLEYQSCETDDYYTTDAYRMLCSMRKQMLQEIFAEEVDYEELNAWLS